jgi:hypothetical protein
MGTAMGQARRRHPGTAVYLAVLAAIAFLLGGEPNPALLPFHGSSSVEDDRLAQQVLWVGALVLGLGAAGALLDGRWGTWLTRAGATASFLAGAYLAFWVAVIDQSAWRWLSFLLVGPPAIGLTAAAAGVLWATRSGPPGTHGRDAGQ